MKRVSQQPYDLKSKLAIEICNMYQNVHFPCIHNQSSYNPASRGFIDWYLILRVEEDASIDMIRRQYHKFALLLHPDKNKHPKAEFAFKLISQAYKCLSDEPTRASFNMERCRILCPKCTTNNSHANHQTAGRTGTPNSSDNKTVEQLRVLRQQLEEEVRVIRSCVRIHRSLGHEYPVFDPSSYAHLGYPHVRRYPLYYDVGRRRRCESPGFEIRGDCGLFGSGSACVSS